MEQITLKETILSLKETAKKRYASITDADHEEIFPGGALILYHTTTDGLNSHVIEADKKFLRGDDLMGFLLAAFYDIKDRTSERHFSDVLFEIMGAIPESELDPDLRANEEFITLDKGYVIPGLIDAASFAEVRTEYPKFYAEDYRSATMGDYSPSNPWDAPGMSISDFI